VLVVGCGDVGLRVLRLLRGRVRLLAVTSSPERVPALRAAGAVPLVADLDDAASLRRLAALADTVLHLAPPPRRGADDPRTAALIAALARSPRTRRWVYGSTSGVYGDCAGDWVAETRATAPTTDRAWRRVAAESRLRAFGRRRRPPPGRASAAVSAWGQGAARVSLLRIPGIYALDRQGGDPRDRVRRGTPVLAPADDVWTNHIHADDLARACVAAIWRGRAQRVVNVSDDTDRRMGEHFDAVADQCGLPRPPRLPREAAARELSPMQMSFLSESRRLVNRRMKDELRLVLRYPRVDDALAAGNVGGGLCFDAPDPGGIGAPSAV
jgi:nucleoside-diphosphate-sugar epimerase